jgi:putative flippase GtrA
MATTIMHANCLQSRVLLLARSTAPRLLRFACTGLIAGAVQLMLLHLWLARGWDGLLANSAAYLVSAQVNFLLSATFIWGDRRDGSWRPRTLLHRWAAFHGAILGTALLNQAVFVVAEQMLPAPVAAGLGIGAGALVNFLVQDRLVFIPRRQPRTIRGDTRKDDAMAPRILIVDDTNHWPRLLAGPLHGDGFAIDTVADAVTAVTAIQDFSYALVLLTAMRDTRDAIIACRTIRGASRIPIIVIAARPDEAGLIAALDAGADDYLATPFAPGELVARIRAVLRPFTFPPAARHTVQPTAA